MKDIDSLFRSFVYAFKGFAWMVGHERNFRIHLTCLLYMCFFLIRFDFFTLTRTQIAILILASVLVLGGEMINSGIEKADDSVSRDSVYTIKVSKDVAAGAVLVFAVGAVLVGIAILYQPKAFKMLYNYYLGNPLSFVLLLVSFVAALLFIFKFDFNKKDIKENSKRN